MLKALNPFKRLGAVKAPGQCEKGLRRKQREPFRAKGDPRHMNGLRHVAQVGECRKDVEKVQNRCRKRCRDLGLMPGNTWPHFPIIPS